MKKKLLSMMLAGVMLFTAACGVKQEDYDKVAAEKEQLAAQLEASKKEVETVKADVDTVKAEAQTQKQELSEANKLLEEANNQINTLTQKNEGYSVLSDALMGFYGKQTICYETEENEFVCVAGKLYAPTVSSIQEAYDDSLEAAGKIGALSKLSDLGYDKITLHVRKNDGKGLLSLSYVSLNKNLEFDSYLINVEHITELTKIDLS